MAASVLAASCGALLAKYARARASPQQVAEDVADFVNETDIVEQEAAVTNAPDANSAQLIQEAFNNKIYKKKLTFNNGELLLGPAIIAQTQPSAAFKYPACNLFWTYDIDERFAANVLKNLPTVSQDFLKGLGATSAPRSD